MFNLVIANTGNRPAIDIKLTIDNQEKFKECIENLEHQLIDNIFRCFEEDATIPLLINGETRSNLFGLISRKTEENLWKYGSSFSITINYKDLEKNKYQSSLSLYIKNSKYFAGSSWS